MNKGMGHKFLKHVERTKRLLFVVSRGRNCEMFSFVSGANEIKLAILRVHI